MKIKLFVAAVVSMLMIGSAKAEYTHTTDFGGSPFTLTITESVTVNNVVSYLFNVQYTGNGQGIAAIGLNAFTVASPSINEEDRIPGIAQLNPVPGLGTAFADLAVLMSPPEDDSHFLYTSGDPGIIVATQEESDTHFMVAIGIKDPSSAVDVDFAIVGTTNGLPQGEENPDGSRTSSVLGFMAGFVSDLGAAAGESINEDVTRVTESAVMFIGVPEPSSLALFGLAGLAFARRRK